MCLYPKRIQNKKYTATKKNGGSIPCKPIIAYTIDESYDIIDEETGEVTRVRQESTPIFDERITYVEVPCGQCQECREKKAHEWQQRLNEEIKEHEYNYFVTFTFSPKGLREICLKYKIKESNAAAAFGLRHALERYRKDYRKSIKHWFITELGHEGTERIHLHGILLSDDKLKFTNLERDPKNVGYYCNWKYWKYGKIFLGDYVNERSINYVVKYMTKIDTDHKGFIGQVLCSPGIGRAFIDRLRLLGNETYKYRPRESKGFYRLKNGSKTALCTYYRNKVRNEEERELIWREFMDTERTTIAGINIEAHSEQEQPILEKAKEINTFLGYGNNSKEWRKKPYNITRRQLTDIGKLKGRYKVLLKREQTHQIDRQQEEELRHIKQKLVEIGEKL